MSFNKESTIIRIRICKKYKELNKIYHKNIYKVIDNNIINYNTRVFNKIKISYSFRMIKIIIIILINNSSNFFKYKFRNNSKVIQKCIFFNSKIKFSKKLII
jgi:hypothetical protein